MQAFKFAPEQFTAPHPERQRPLPLGFVPKRGPAFALAGWVFAGFALLALVTIAFLHHQEALEIAKSAPATAIEITDRLTGRLDKMDATRRAEESQDIAKLVTLLKDLTRANATLAAQVHVLVEENRQTAQVTTNSHAEQREAAAASAASANQLSAMMKEISDTVAAMDGLLNNKAVVQKLSERQNQLLKP